MLPGLSRIETRTPGGGGRGGVRPQETLRGRQREVKLELKLNDKIQKQTIIRREGPGTCIQVQFQAKLCSWARIDTRLIQADRHRIGFRVA